ncbi:MAG: glycosyltransferase [Chloroflexota bacterium]
MRTVFFWDAVTGLSLELSNPYGGLLAKALAPLDVEIVAGYPKFLNENWIRENRSKVDVLHLNWPHYTYDVGDLEGSLARCAGVIGCLAYARSLGYKVVWTVHNLYPHHSTSHNLDHLARLALVNIASALIVHCQHARHLIEENFFRRDGVFEIPHGHFISMYPNTLSRDEARQQLGLPKDGFVYLTFGNVKPYKGIERLMNVFSGMPGDDLRLLLMAKVFDEYGQQLAGEVARTADPRIVMHTSSNFPNEDLQIYLNAADVVVLPFLDVLTSGTAITALGFSRPVIAPAIGCLSELIDDRVGLTYDPQNPEALGEAMQAARKRDLPPMTQAALHRAETLDWDSIALKTLEAYRY